jgi:hypothetical protein
MKKALLPFSVLVEHIVHRLDVSLASPQQINELVSNFGWYSDIQSQDVQSIRNYFSLLQLKENIVDYNKRISANQVDNNLDFIQLKQYIISFFDAVRALNSVSGITSLPFPFNQPTFWTQLASELPDYLLTYFIRHKSEHVYSFFQLFGIIEQETVIISDSGRFSYTKNKICWDKIKDALINPVSLVKENFNWGSTTNSFDHIKLFTFLDEVARRYYFKARTSFPEQALALNYYTLSDIDNHDIKQINIPFISGATWDGDDFIDIGIKILPIPAVPLSNQEPAGIVILPILRGGINETFKLTRDLSVNVKGEFNLNNSFELKLLPTSSSLTTNSAVPSLYSGISFIYYPELPILIWGDRDSTRFELTGFQFKVELVGIINDPEFIVSIGLPDFGEQHCRFYYQPGEGDSFIKKILGNEKKQLDFDFNIKWSSKHGLSVNGNGGLQFEIPIHIKEGPLSITKFRLGLIAGSDGFSLTSGADIIVETSVFSLSINNIGAKFNLVEIDQNSASGLLGGADIDFNFKPPTGAGIKIKSPTISGGGFLNFNEATKTYTGALELTFKKFSLRAFGIISTQLPDGSDGYSLLIFITSEFQPIQIGMGFTLNGVGGMLGMNRTTNVEFLRAGIRDNTLSNLLFPTDVVANASALISTADQAFPVQEGRFVFGPMAKLGWGTPTILTIDLGIIAEVPDPVSLKILGVLKAILPDQQKQTLKLQVNFLGVIDFDKGELAFDASIYDSSLLTYALSGDMALRLSWGSNPNFLLSVGGFHPSYTPPPLNLPALRRIAVQIFNEDNLRVRFETYLAITSNSAQFGARLEAFAKAGKFNALAQLWFDLLFQFSPFHMLANMGANVTINREDKPILSAFLNLSVEGPGPWRVWGEVNFEVAKIGFSIRFDKTFGQGAMEVNMPVAVLDKVQDAIAAKDNWTAVIPPATHQLVAFRNGQTSASLIVEPFTQLSFTQQVLPLGVTLGKYGNAPLADYKQFSITNIEDGNNQPLFSQPVNSAFARNEFFYMSDSDKLSKPAYEQFNSGVLIGSDQLKANYFVHRLCSYEDIVIDKRQRQRPTNWPVLSVADLEGELLGNIITQSPLSETPFTSPHDAPVQVALTNGRFTLANMDDLAIYGNTPVYFDNETQAEQFRNTVVAANPLLADQLIVINELELVA